MPRRSSRSRPASFTSWSEPIGSASLTAIRLPARVSGCTVSAGPAGTRLFGGGPRRKQIPMPERSRTTRTMTSFALAAAVLAAGSLGVIVRGPALFVGASFALVGAVSLVGEGRESRSLRRRADEVLEVLPTDRVPGRLRWRARELTTERERRRLAGSLRS